jgi:hypothetical protein
VKSSCKPTRTVSSMLESSGSVGAEPSSRERFDHPSTCPMTPMSEEVLSPATNIYLLGSQSFSTDTKEPGGRRAGNDM